MKNNQNKEPLILEYIKERVANGLPPTIREICAEFQIKSTSTAHKYLKNLEEKGLIKKGVGQNRAIWLGDEITRAMDSIPVIGVVTAGQPILAFEEITDYIPYKNGKYPLNELFALKVSGDSMINAGILNDDLVIVRKTMVAHNGEIVVALIGEEATVKRFYKENGHFRLQPENDSYEPIIVNEVRILGKVITVIRTYE